MNGTPTALTFEQLAIGARFKAREVKNALIWTKVSATTADARKNSNCTFAPTRRVYPV